jgi:hypothetical protein
MRVEDVPPEVQNEIVQRYLRQIAARGGRSGSRLGKRLRALKNADRVWRLRRARYGPTGRTLVDTRLAARLEGGPPSGWKRASPGGKDA